MMPAVTETSATRGRPVRGTRAATLARMSDHRRIRHCRVCGGATAYVVPADDNHRFGHGKAESIAGLAQAMFIAGSGLFLIIESIERWVQPRPINELGVGLAVMAFAIVATLILLVIQAYVIRRTN